MSDSSLPLPKVSLLSLLEKSHREWIATVDGIPDLVLLVDHEGIILRGNRTAERWGLIPNIKEIPGKPFHTLLHPLCRHSHCPIKTFSFSQEEKEIIHQYRDPYLKKDLEWIVRPVKISTSNKELSFVMIFRDLTRINRLIDLLKQKKNLIKNISILLLQRKGTPLPELLTTILQKITHSLHIPAIYLSIPSIPYLMGVTPKGSLPHEEVEKTFGDILPAPFQTERKGNQLLSRNGTKSALAFSHLFSIQGKEKKTLGYLLIKKKKVLPEEREFFAILTEILYYTILEEHHAKTESQLKELELLSLLAGQTSHELKNFLVSLEFFLTNLKEEERIPKEWCEYFQVIHHHTLRIKRLSENFLLLSRSEEPSRFSSFLFLPWLQSVITEWEANTPLPRPPIQIWTDHKISELRIRGNPSLLEHVFINLLDNAREFSPPDQPIWIRTETKDESFLQIQIEDSGEGVPDEDLPKLFTPYFTKRRKGLGIGLVVTKKIVEEHNGSIQGERKCSGKGMIFTIRLPIEK